MLVLGAYRSDEIPRAHQLRRLRNDLRRNRSLTELTLEPLTARGTAELAERVLGAAPVRAARRHAARPHGRHPVLHRGARRGARGRRAAASPGRRRRARARCRRAAAADDPRRRAAAGRRPVRSGPRDRGGGLGGGHPLRRRARGRARLGGWSRRAARERSDRGARARPRRLPASARARRDLRGRAVAAPAFAAPRAGRGARGARRRSGRGGRALARGSRRTARARLAGAGGRRSSRPSTPTATRRVSGARRSTCGPRGNAARSGSRCSSATRASRSSRASWPRRPARSARWWRHGAPRAPAVRSPTPSGRLAAIYELQGDRERALTARRVAADAFAANGLPGEAAAERLIAAGYLQSAGNHGDAVELTRRAGEEAGRAERTDLRARVLGLEGVARVKGGEFDEGMETIRAGLSLALEHELTARGGGGVPAARHGARDRGRLRWRARCARHRDRLLRDERSRTAWSTRASAAWPTCCASWATGSAPSSSRTSCAPRARARTPRWWRTAFSDRSTPSAASRRPPGRCSSSASTPPRASTWSR